MNIGDEAVEAAVDALVMTRMGDYNIDMPSFRTAARQVLEAAAPYIASAAWERGREDGYHHRPNPYKEEAK